MTSSTFRFGVLLAIGAGLAMAQKARLAGPIDETRMAAVQNSIHPLARQEFDRGPADTALKLNYITMVLKPTAAQQGDLENLLVAQQDRSSASYHKWLTPEQFGDRFGMAASDVSTIRAWISAHGFHIEDTARGRNWIAFSGTVGQVNRALHAEIHTYQVKGQTHFANTANPSLPAQLANVVRFFRGLDDFEPEPPTGAYNVVPAPAFTSASGSHSLAPDDFATIYDITPLYNSNIYGDQQSIAVLGRTDLDIPGYQTFRSIYGLPATTPVMHLVGPDPGSGASADFAEAMADVELAGAVGRNATVIYVYANSINTAAQEAVDKNLAPVITSSYSSCEPNSVDTIRYLAQQANAQGITWVVVTNDSGAAACHDHASPQQLASTGYAIAYPTSIPEITAVGGTQFNDTTGTYWKSTNSSTGASVLSYIPEIGWNQDSASGIFSGGGGSSIFYPKPIWQTGPGVPADKARDIPDVSMTGSSHDGYRVYFNGENFTFSGTSAATPSFAGVISLLNQYQIKNGFQTTPGMGNINPELYRLAQSYPAAFHDITTGNNNVPCVQSSPDCSTGSFGYSAGIGYDLVTGIGSVDVNNLITHWNQNGAPSKTAVSASQSSVAFDAKPQLTATVSASGGVPTGTVSFLIPGEGLASLDLGSVALTQSGVAGSGSIVVDPNLLALGLNNITAVYSGDNKFDVSSGTTTITVTPPTSAAAIVASSSPNPVYGQASTTGVTGWYYTLTLTNLSSVAATLTDFTVAGTDEASRLSTFFSNTAIPAHGSISAAITTTNITVPQNRAFTFTGTDANGNTWNQQLTVPFIQSILQPEIVLTGVPAAVQQNASSTCPWMQHLHVQQTSGFDMQLFKFLSGSTDLTNQISSYFGTTEIAPFGALEATICSTGSAPPANVTYELDGQTYTGSTFRTVFTTSYAAAPAAPATLAIAESSVALNTGSKAGTLSVNINGSAAWTASIYPSNPTTNWLTISPASGAGPGTITATASATGQAPGVYRATVIVQGANLSPQFVEVPVTFTIGGSPSISIQGVSNGASFQTKFAPGMILSVFGTGLAPGVQAASAVPLTLSMQGVSATVNGFAAPLYYVSPTQINLQVPYETGAQSAVVGINNNGSVASFSFATTPTAPGIFVSNGNLVPTSTGSPGSEMVLFMTGEGDVSPELTTGAAPSASTALSNLPQPRLPVTVTVGGITAPIAFIGIPPALVGVTQINFVVPANVPAGVQPVVVTTNGIASTAANITVTNP